MQSCSGEAEQQKPDGERSQEIALQEFISDVFNASYAQFLLNFDTSGFIDAMSKHVF